MCDRHTNTGASGVTRREEPSRNFERPRTVEKPTPKKDPGGLSSALPTQETLNAIMKTIGDPGVEEKRSASHVENTPAKASTETPESVTAATQTRAKNTISTILYSVPLENLKPASPAPAHPKTSERPIPWNKTHRGRRGGR